MTDKIIIDKLRVTTIIGVNQTERQEKQDLFVTITLYVDCTQIGATDDIQHTIDYSRLASSVTSRIQNLASRTLEHLAVNLCGFLFSSLPNSVQNVKLKIEKLAIKAASFATVQLKRSRNQFFEIPSRSKLHGLPLEQSPSSSTSKSIVTVNNYERNRMHASLRLNIYEKCGLDFCGPISIPLKTNSTKPSKSVYDIAYIAIGSNIANRSRNISQAIAKLRQFGNLRRVSFLYETPAAYYSNQRSFLNCCVAIDTDLNPSELLKAVKQLEIEVGRTPTFQYGPRVIDLDIIFYGNQTSVNTDILTIPHKLMHERAFVLVPLLDIIPHDFTHPAFASLPLALEQNHIVESNPQLLPYSHSNSEKSTGKFITILDLFLSLKTSDIEDVKRVIPIVIEKKDPHIVDTSLLRQQAAPSNGELSDQSKIENSNQRNRSQSEFTIERLIRCESHRSSTIIMGILNITPDSFSDGGMNLPLGNAIKSIQSMVQSAGTSELIIDIGGESTNIQSQPVDTDTELERVLPIFDHISKLNQQSSVMNNDNNDPNTTNHILTSCDTTKLPVAKECFKRGCNILNDVYSVSRYYSDRIHHEEVCLFMSSVQKPWIIMHSRGTAQTMMEMINYESGNVVNQIASEMIPVIRSILESGVLPWNVILDPGIGFAKQMAQNIEILQNLQLFTHLTGNFPLLVGASNKRFLGTIVGKLDMNDRNVANLAAAAGMIQNGANFIRVHNVQDTSDLKKVYETIWKL